MNKNDDIMIPAHWDTPDARAYIAKIIAMPFGEIAGYLEGVDLCQDCDEIAIDLSPEDRDRHALIGIFCVIGCGGYFQIQLPD